MSLASLLQQIRDVMRSDSGVDGDAQRLAQIAWLIFLRIFDYNEEISELDKGDSYVPVIPVGYRWRDWAVGTSIKDQLTGQQLLDFVNNELLPVLAGKAITKDGRHTVIFNTTDERSLFVKDSMQDVVNYMKDGYLLRKTVNLVGSVNFDSTGDAHEFNNVYETLLSGLQAQKDHGEFYTPRAITSFVIEKVNPVIGETFADWAAGTGGFLVDALEHLKEQAKGTKDMATIQTSIYGGELKPMAYRLCVTNLLLHGIELPTIRRGDSLNIKNFSEFTEADQVDTCSLNPPYGGVALDIDKLCFPTDMRSSETADLFVALLVKRLKKNGRGGIVLPDGFLFGTDNAKLAIKKYLLQECNLHTIVRLPQSCFAPYTSIATNLVFFDKTGPTQETWFYRLDMPDGYKHFSKTKPIKSEHFNPVREWWSNRVEIQDEKEHESMTKTWKAKKFSIDEIKARDYNLDLCGYPVEEKIILSPEETIQQYMKKRDSLDAEIDRKLADILSLLGVQ